MWREIKNKEIDTNPEHHGKEQRKWEMKAVESYLEVMCFQFIS